MKNGGRCQETTYFLQQHSSRPSSQTLVNLLRWFPQEYRWYAFPGEQAFEEDRKESNRSQIESFQIPPVDREDENGIFHYAVQPEEAPHESHRSNWYSCRSLCPRSLECAGELRWTNKKSSPQVYHTWAVCSYIVQHYGHLAKHFDVTSSFPALIVVSASRCPCAVICSALPWGTTSSWGYGC